MIASSIEKEPRRAMAKKRIQRRCNYRNFLIMFVACFSLLFAGYVFSYLGYTWAGSVFRAIAYFLTVPALVYAVAYAWKTLALIFASVLLVAIGTASPIQSKPILDFPLPDEKFHENFAVWLSENNGLPEAIQWNLEQR